MRVVCLLLLSACWLANPGAHAHGGVVLEDDVCVLKIGFLKAHFTGYQPRWSGNEEFCEDIPVVGNSVFVIDYLHDFLREMRVDFRIINDVNSVGIFASWDDVLSVTDLDAATVFYLPPEVRNDGVLTAEHEFEEAGNYIGVVTAHHPTQDKSYNAVFAFAVGDSGIGYVPLFLGAFLLAQFIYWVASGGLKRFLAARATAR
ncbi:MAG: hypothetical protein O6766_13940 [Gammaproteobacteria bacterium]|nr:hypothetical protein [Gammaproteobacteria bacterium]